MESELAAAKASAAQLDGVLKVCVMRMRHELGTCLFLIVQDVRTPALNYASTPDACPVTLSPQLRAKELERLRTDTDTAKEAQAAAELRATEAEAHARQANAETAAARQRLVQAEASAKARERDGEKAGKTAEQLRAAVQEAQAQVLSRGCRRMSGRMTRSPFYVVHAPVACRARQ